MQRVDYDEFGRVLARECPTLSSDDCKRLHPFGFAGDLYDPDTGLVRFGARDYDAATGRWTAKDPIKFRGRDANLYGYVVGDPVNLLDAKGLWAAGVSTGLRVAWAQRGYNPHHRKVPSYYPITAYEAQSGHVLRVQNRPGNVNDAKGGRRFLRALFAQLRATLGPGYRLEVRMDGAFFQRDILEHLEREEAEYAIKVPFHPWLGLKARVQATRGWTRVTADVSCAEHDVPVACWARRCRIVIYRRHVRHETAKNFQLDLFDPNDGHYEYSAVVTNKSLGGPALWTFMAGRGIHEKVYGELKSGFAFGCVPSMQYAANSAWQCLSVLAFNLSRSFQLATTARRRRPSRKRWTLFRFETIHTQRALCFQRAGVLVSPHGTATLDIGTSPGVADRFRRLDRLLAA